MKGAVLLVPLRNFGMGDGRQIEGVRERFCCDGKRCLVMERGAETGVREKGGMSCEGKRRNGCGLIWCVDQRLMRGEL
jgi:hypothetical protein